MRGLPSLFLGFWVALTAAMSLSFAQEISEEEAARFLMQASFGPNQASIAELRELGYIGWLEAQMAMPPRAISGRVLPNIDGPSLRTGPRVLADYFWEHALYGEDQLRQRLHFALSQIVVVSLTDAETADAVPAYLDYVDALDREALGNYCSLIRTVSFLPTMATYLTFYENQKADEDRGVVPDENYAREVMQLFTIGLEELTLNGTSTGKPTYDQDDVAGLASVFTGLALPGEDFTSGDRNAKPFRGRLIGYPSYHEARAKRFLGATVGPGDDPVESVNAALDHLLDHPNVAPFVVKQLIQKLVTSNPSPDYIQRVADVFNKGIYQHQSGTTFGGGQRCDMQATTAAILLDPEARAVDDQMPANSKVREPLIRITHALRAAAPQHAVTTTGVLPEARALNEPDDAWARQMPYRSPTVFNFYRPTYVQPGSMAEEAGAVAPETQIMTATHFAAQTTWVSRCVVQGRCRMKETYRPDINFYLQVAGDPKRLVDRLDLVLTAGGLEKKTRSRIISALWKIDVPHGAARQRALTERVALAFAMITTSPEYMVQR